MDHHHAVHLPVEAALVEKGDVVEGQVVPLGAEPGRLGRHGGSDRGVDDGLEPGSAGQGSENTRAAMPLRSSSASGPRTPGPNSCTMAARAGEPARTASRASRSASMTGAPRARSASANVLFPLAMPPVSPTRRIGSALLSGGRNPGGGGRALLRIGPGAAAPGFAPFSAAWKRMASTVPSFPKNTFTPIGG